jgi:hypothetical protein
MARLAAIVAAGLVALAAGAAPVAAALPDLVSDAPTAPRLGTYTVGGESRLLLRFNSFVHNREGAGPLDVRASIAPGGPNGTVTSLEQWYDGAGHAMPGAELVFDDEALGNEDGHDHFHLQRASEYSLRTPQGDLVAPAAKVGFCLLDSLRVGSAPDPDEPFSSFCLPDERSEVRMGVSPGWRDLYSWNLAHQWVDVSNVVPGTYALHSVVDPDDVVDESAEDNPISPALGVRVPGHVARERRSADGAASVVLATTEHQPLTGTLAAPRFRIEAPPAHGSVDRPVGAWFTDPVVRYTPDDPANPRPDELTYVARAQDSAFPLSAPTAKVLFGGGTRIAISAAPAQVYVGTTVVLSAPGATAWTASAGSVTSTGAFTAPASAGTVTVRASDPAGSTDAVRIEVLPAPPAEPAPVPHHAPGGDSALVPPAALAPGPPAALPRRAIIRADAEQIGRYVAVSLLPGRSGRVRIVLRRGTRTVGSCRVRATAGRALTCRLRRPRTGRGRLRVVVQLTRLDGGKLSRTVPIAAAHHR